MSLSFRRGGSISESMLAPLHATWCPWGKGTGLEPRRSELPPLPQMALGESTDLPGTCVK